MEENEVLKPRNSLELMRWVIFEPMLLEEYSDTVKDRGARLRGTLIPVLWMIFGSFVIYFLFILFISILKLMHPFPLDNQEVITKNWIEELYPIVNWHLKSTFWIFLIGLVIGLTLNIVITLIDGLSGALSGFLAYSLSVPLGLCFVFNLGMGGGLIVSWLNGCGLGFAVGLPFGLVFGARKGLAKGLMLGLFGGLAIGLSIYSLSGGVYNGLIVSWGYLCWFLFCYFRCYLYIAYANPDSLKKYSFQKNPHYQDGVILFPLLGLGKEFQKQAYDEPEKALEFSRFLFKKRRLQKQLAWQVQLASIAGQWRKKRLHTAILKTFPEINEAVVWYEDKEGFFNLSRKVVQLPSSDWQPQIETTRLRLLEFEQESNVQIRVNYFRKFINELDKLYDLALRQPHSWGQYFVKALELWQKSATEKLRELELDAQTEEPIVANIYRGGEKLRPDDRALFLGRTDLRDAFKKRVVTAVQMPMFFIQGQRRVGKSSVIAFLPTILDRGFNVVAYDMQEQPGLALPVLLEKILGRVRSTLGIDKTPPPLAQVVDSDIQNLLPDALEQRSGIQTSWLDAWQHFRTEFEAIADQHPAKIVLAIDEYEDFHRILQSDPTQGDALLAAMRAYSQSQNRVVFLFAGADYFSELKNPDWGTYFVQAERVLVGYLDHDDSLKLIQLVDLRYPPELLERMYHETQGHPCLLQKICREVVTIVNKTGRESRAVTEADYDAAIKKEIIKPDDGVMSIFWGQFCENRGLKPVVRQILAGETPTDERALLVLEDHGFILREGNHIRLRVPLFEQWLHRYQVM